MELPNECGECCHSFSGVYTICAYDRSKVRICPSEVRPDWCPLGELDSEGFETLHETGLMIDNGWFMAGVRCKAIYISTMETSMLYKVGYYLWGADIWFGRVPVIKSLLLANIIVWVLLIWLS